MLICREKNSTVQFKRFNYSNELCDLSSLKNLQKSKFENLHSRMSLHGQIAINNALNLDPIATHFYDILPWKKTILKYFIGWIHI